MKKKVLLFFSGGLDSTYLLYKNIQEGNDVTCFYSRILNNGIKTDYEERAVNNIISIFEASKRIFKIKSSIQLEGIPPENPQIILNLNNAIFYGINSDYDEIQIGYTIGDIALSYIKEFEEVYNNALNLFAKKDKKTILSFPLLKEHKYNMLMELHESSYYKVIEMISSCEKIIDNGGILQTCDMVNNYSNCCDCCATNYALTRHTNLAEKLINQNYNKKTLTTDQEPVKTEELYKETMEIKGENVETLVPESEEIYLDFKKFFEDNPEKLKELLKMQVEQACSAKEKMAIEVDTNNIRMGSGNSSHYS